MKYDYPKVEKSDFVEEFHGNKIPDPFSPLEEPDAEITKQFVTQQNEVFQVKHTKSNQTLKYFKEISIWAQRSQRKYPSKDY